ncbi:MAG: hypothetical protein EB070_09320, partial [Synechococcaceae bacterium WBA_2_066]|nr:hypothetical protein [Synechococcaceae bacterium WBA_2_066]
MAKAFFKQPVSGYLEHRSAPGFIDPSVRKQPRRCGGHNPCGGGSFFINPRGGKAFGGVDGAAAAAH